MARLSLTLLGGFQCRPASGPALTFPTKKAQALLAYLALRPGQPHPRGKLAALLWGDTGEEQARSSLRQAVHTLRKALCSKTPPGLLIDGETLALSPLAVDVDAAAFERLAAEGAPEALEQAAALYRGEFLEGLDVKEAPFEEWLIGERERLRELALEALAKLLACQSKAGETERAIQTAVRLLALDPLQEAAHRALMRLYVSQGRRGAALKQYQLCVGVLQRELGAQPESETRQLYEEILKRQPAGAAKTEAQPISQAHRPRRETVQSRPEAPTRESPLIGREPELARGARSRHAKRFVEHLARNFPVVAPSIRDWARSGRIVRMVADRHDFEIHKIRELHFDVLIALTAQSVGAHLITCNAADFQIIREVLPFKLTCWRA